MGFRINLLVTTVAIFSPFMASAEMFQMDNGYVSGAGAWNMLGDQDIRDGSTTMEAEFKDGWGALGTIGGRFNNNYRAELEIGYRDNEVDSITGSPVDSDGSNNAWTFMVNGLYDFTNTSRFTPYLGLGIGAARLEYVDVPTSATTIIEDDNVQAAVQGIIGINYKMSDNLSVFTNYQYLTTGKYKLKADSGSGLGNDSYQANTILAGLTYNFGAPKQTTKYEPAAAEVTQNNYTLLFDWNKSALTKEGTQVVNTAADKALGMQNVQIDVTGHADTSGTSDYNMELSRARAENVKKALVKRGIPAKDIMIYAKGEAEPAVDTGDGVKDLENRRVVIVYPAM